VEFRRLEPLSMPDAGGAGPGHAARVSVSSRLSRIFGLIRPTDDTDEIRSDHGQRRSVASASRKLGAAFFWYQGLASQVTVVPKLGMYHVQMAA